MTSYIVELVDLERNIIDHHFCAVMSLPSILKYVFRNCLKLSNYVQLWKTFF